MQPARVLRAAGRASTAGGDAAPLVGAGGIGLQLPQQIRTYDFDQVSFIVLLVLAAVAAIDRLSGRWRAAMVGRKPALT